MGETELEMAECILALFNRWIEKRVALRYFSNFSYPDASDSKKIYHSSLNPFLKTEADIQVKFGGFLEEHLFRKGYTVHAELTGIYNGRNSRPDLSVHKIQKEAVLWKDETPNLIMESLRAVIEIKYITYREPKLFFKNESIIKDIKKMSDLPVLKFLLLFDENIKDGGDFGISFDDIKKEAEKEQVIILSNNQTLKS